MSFNGGKTYNLIRSPPSMEQRSKNLLMTAFGFGKIKQPLGGWLLFLSIFTNIILIILLIRKSSFRSKFVGEKSQEKQFIDRSKKVYGSWKDSSVVPNPNVRDQIPVYARI